MNEHDSTSESREEGRYENDLLAPEQPRAEGAPPLDMSSNPETRGEQGVHEDHEPERNEPAAQSPAYQSAEPSAPRDPIRRLARVGWAMVAVTLVLAVVALVGWLKINSSVDKVACIQKAQATFDAAVTGANLSTSALGLARIGLHKDLNKCG